MLQTKCPRNCRLAGSSPAAAGGGGGESGGAGGEAGGGGGGGDDCGGGDCGGGDGAGGDGAGGADGTGGAGVAGAIAGAPAIAVIAATTLPSAPVLRLRLGSRVSAGFHPQPVQPFIYLPPSVIVVAK